MKGKNGRIKFKNKKLEPTLFKQHQLGDRHYPISTLGRELGIYERAEKERARERRQYLY